MDRKAWSGSPATAVTAQRRKREIEQATTIDQPPDITYNNGQATPHVGEEEIYEGGQEGEALDATAAEVKLLETDRHEV